MERVGGNGNNSTFKILSIGKISVKLLEQLSGNVFYPVQGNYFNNEIFSLTYIHIPIGFIKASRRDLPIKLNTSYRSIRKIS